MKDSIAIQVQDHDSIVFVDQYENGVWFSIQSSNSSLRVVLSQSEAQKIIDALKEVLS